MSVPSQDLSPRSCGESKPGKPFGFKEASWRQQLVARYASKRAPFGAPIAQCSPRGYVLRPDECACRLCPGGTCVSRRWLRTHPPLAALGFGSGVQREIMRMFLCDAQRAKLVAVSPVNEPCFAAMYDGLVDVVLDTEAVEKPEPSPAECASPTAAQLERRRRCANAIRAREAGATLATAKRDPPCAIVGPPAFPERRRAFFFDARAQVYAARIKPDKGQRVFLEAMTSSPRARSLLALFNIAFYGTGEDDEVAALRALVDRESVRATFEGYVKKDAIHAAYCDADAVVLLSGLVHGDRNPRVPYEAASAFTPARLSGAARGSAGGGFERRGHPAGLPQPRVPRRARAPRRALGRPRVGARRARDHRGVVRGFRDRRGPRPARRRNALLQGALPRPGRGLRRHDRPFSASFYLSAAPPSRARPQDAVADHAPFQHPTPRHRKPVFVEPDLAGC